LEGVPARKFNKFISSGAAGRIAGLENVEGINVEELEAAQEKGEIVKVEDVNVSSIGAARTDAPGAPLYHLGAA